MLLILFFTIVLNAVAIALTYYCLLHLEKKEKLIFIAIGVGTLYILTSIVYWISTKGIDIKAVSDLGKNIITFLFVPINGIVILPVLARAYAKYKGGMIKFDHFKNRGILIAIILLIILIIECSYFKDIQNGVISAIEKSKMESNAKQDGVQKGNVISNATINNVVSNAIGLEE